LGVHAIIAGFFAGLVLSDTIKSEVLFGKLRALSYGFFIPTFFVVVGLTTDISLFFTDQSVLYLLVVLTLVAVFIKLITGWLGAWLAAFPARERWLVAATTLPQLSTTLAVVVTAQEFGLLPVTLATVLIGLGIITALLGPMMIAWSGQRI